MAATASGNAVVETSVTAFGEERPDFLPSDLRVQIRYATSDNGEELLWAEPLATGLYRILSVPVFVYGVSRGSVVEVRAPASATEVRAASRVAQESPSATVRLYADDRFEAGRLYLEEVAERVRERGVSVGPATILDPSIVAINVTVRSEWERFAAVLDDLVATKHARFWELGDPDLSPVADEVVEYVRAPWRLVHPPPGDPVSTAIKET